MTPALGTVPAQRVCGWCMREIAPGSLPASHGICPGCYVRLQADMDVREARRPPIAASR